MRHRHVGKLDGLCSVELTGGSCALPYASDWHYRDGQHPYTLNGPPESMASDAAGVCWWVLQEGAMAGAECGRAALTAVHCSDGDSERGRVMDKGEFFGSPDETAVLDREAAAYRWNAPEVVDGSASPAEDGSGGLAVDGGGLTTGDPLAYAVADAILEGLPVVAGPWPLRQWCVPDGGAALGWEEPNELMCALNVLGEAFLTEAWWRDSATRMVRVVWGSLLGLPEADVIAAVRSWDE